MWPTSPLAAAVAGPSSDVFEGFRALTSSAFVIALVVTQVATNVLYGMETVLYALTSTQRLGMDVDGVAFLYAAIGVGGIAAAGLAHRLSRRSEAGLVLAGATVLCGLPMATIALVSEPSIALAVLLLEGAAMIVVDVLVVTSLQRLLGADVLGRAFGTLDALIVAGILVGSVLAPILVTTVGLQAALLIGGGMMAVAGVAVLTQARAIDRSIETYAGPLRERVSSLRRLAIFRGASRATLEHVAEVMREEPVDAGDRRDPSGRCPGRPVRGARRQAPGLVLHPRGGADRRGTGSGRLLRRDRAPADGPRGSPPSARRRRAVCTGSRGRSSWRSCPRARSALERSRDAAQSRLAALPTEPARPTRTEG